MIKIISENNKILIKNLNDILIKIGNGKIIESIKDIEKLNVESNVLEIKELILSIKKISVNIYETLNFANLIASGDLNSTVDKSNHLIDSLKQLQATLKHLTWQLKQISKGDYNQNVSYLGDFSEAFNLMINALREKDEKIRHSKELYEKLILTVPDVVALVDLEGKILFINEPAVEFLGYNLDELIGTSIFELIIPEQRQYAVNNMKKRYNSQINLVEYKYVRKNGIIIDIETNGNLLKDKKGEPYGIVYITRDITLRKEKEHQLEQAKIEIENINAELNKKNLLLSETNNILMEKSITDSLTKLYNHQYIYDIVVKQSQLSKTAGQALCIMMADIDFFKRVNDDYGHLIGDGVIITLTQVIKNIIRKNDFAGRYGGEEFLVVLPKTKLNEAINIAEKIRKSIETQKFDAENLKVTISIGVAEYSGEEAALLINKADKLLYKAKENGRNRIEY